MTDMLHHAKCVHRGNQTSFLVGDMPFGSYEPSSALAVENAMRLIKEANMNAIKLEGGKRMAARAKAIVDAGIPVPPQPPPPWGQRLLTTGTTGGR
jgi:3-methyl-2-oxobutanoate hydroxymethyltransferase